MYRLALGAIALIPFVSCTDSKKVELNTAKTSGSDVAVNGEETGDNPLLDLLSSGTSVELSQAKFPWDSTYIGLPVQAEAWELEIEHEVGMVSESYLYLGDTTISSNCLDVYAQVEQAIASSSTNSCIQQYQELNLLKLDHSDKIVIPVTQELADSGAQLNLFVMGITYNQSNEVVGASFTDSKLMDFLSVGEHPIHAHKVFLESNNSFDIAIEEAESSQWRQETIHDFFWDEAYYRADVNQDPDSNINEDKTLKYYFYIDGHASQSNPVCYNLTIRNRHDHPEDDKENDCWTSADGGHWFKTYSNQGGSTQYKWNCHTNTDPHGTPSVPSWYPGNPSYNHKQTFFCFDSPGKHLFEIAARSKNYKADNFQLTRTNSPGTQNSPTCSPGHNNDPDTENSKKVFLDM